MSSDCRRYDFHRSSTAGFSPRATKLALRRLHGQRKHVPWLPAQRPVANAPPKPQPSTPEGKEDAVHKEP